MARNLCILDPLGKLLLLFGLIMFLPATLAAHGEGDQDGLVALFLWPGCSCAIGGALAWLLGRGRQQDFKLRHASLLVIMIWLFLPVIGSYPLLSYTSHDFVDAYFEAVSGLTASGATVMTGIDELPDPIKLWRGLLSWMGGLGLIVLAVAILPNLGVGGRQMVKSEITGPLKDQDITPQINETAKGLWLVYLSLTTACALAYLACGMNALDALVHSFTTMSLGGFSNHDRSFAYFDSPLIEAVAVMFMLVAGFNFATHFSSFAMLRLRLPRFVRRWRAAIGSLSATLAGKGAPAGHPMERSSLFPERRKTLRQRLAAGARVYRRDAEFRPYLMTLAFSCVVVCAAIYLATDASLTETLRHGIFNTVSIATTTGYSNFDYYHWPLFIGFWILLLANFTSCSGSTGGGIKMVRFLTVIGRIRAEQVTMLHPNAYVEVKVHGRTIPDSVVSSILFFVLAYCVSIMLTALLLLTVQVDLDMVTALSAAMACVSNTGPGLGDVGPAGNYAILNEAATFIGALAMLIGRLELLIFLLLFSRSLWR